MKDDDDHRPATGGEIAKRCIGQKLQVSVLKWQMLDLA
jgi:hypothetical protein